MSLPVQADMEARPLNALEPAYDFSSPLWDRYFQRTRQTVRFPRNYKEVSALDEE